MFRSLIVLVGALVAWGCASAPKAGPELQARAMTFQPPPGASRIYVVRPEGFMGAAVPLEVVVDSMFVGKLTPGTFVMTDVVPGDHVVACPSGESRAMLPLRTEPDSVYFLKLVPQWGAVIASATLESLPPDEGRRWVRETEMVRRQELQDE